MSGVVVLISGRGSNLRALVEARLPVRAVLSNQVQAAGLTYAREKGIPTGAIDHRDFASRAAFDEALAAAIEACSPELVVLAGFMRVLSSGFVARFRARLLNIHPSLLPAFTGLHTHARALAAGVKIHGATVHWVDEILDHGPILIQAAVPVLPGDDEAAPAARVLVQEHRIYPLAVRWMLDGQIEQHGECLRHRLGLAQYLWAGVPGSTQ